MKVKEALPILYDMGKEIQDVSKNEALNSAIGVLELFLDHSHETAYKCPECGELLHEDNDGDLFCVKCKHVEPCNE